MGICIRPFLLLHTRPGVMLIINFVISVRALRSLWLKLVMRSQ